MSAEHNGGDTVKSIVPSWKDIGGKSHGRREEKMVATMTAAGATDAEVIAASWRAPECFGALHDRYMSALYRYAAQRVGPTAAEDVVAETFLAAFRQRRRYDMTRPDARPWLFGILTRRIARWGRTETNHYRAYARGAVPVVASDGLADRVSERVTAQAMRGRLAAALCRLSSAD